MNKKRGKSIKININMSNRVLYTLIIIGILAIVGVSVYAATYTASGAGHPYTEISTCGANQVLKMNPAGTAWECGTALTQEYGDANYKDPPGQWTCTIRSASGAGGNGHSAVTISAACLGSEKVISGGCRANSNVNYLTGSYPYSNGWSCYCRDSNLCSTVYAYAYCCL